MFVVLLDDFHLDDLLFVQSLGRLMAGSGRRCVFVHGDGGVAARALEAQGVFDDAGAEGADAVRAALRLQSKKITGRLTDAGLSAVGFQGSDRGLLAVDAAGAVRAGRTAWIVRLVETEAVPVVSALAAKTAGAPSAGAGEGGEPVPVAPAEAVAALAGALGGASGGATAVVFTRTGRPGVGESEPGERGLASLAQYAADLGDGGAAAALGRGGAAVLVTSPPAFFAPGGPSGSRFGPEIGSGSG